jgi:hypothetical protein
MTVKLPYMVTPGVIPRVLTKIREARRPERFTQDYLETMLGIRGGNARAIIPLLKRMNFLNADGTPTALYDRYRNDDSRAVAIAEGIRKAYDDVFSRNQFAFSLPRDKFASLVREMTGLEKESQVGSAVVGTFFTLKDGADFEGKTDDPVSEQTETRMPEAPAQISAPPVTSSAQPQFQNPPPSDGVEFRVGYTINLNLPETTNPDVFNAIFKSLKEHLLRN